MNVKDFIEKIDNKEAKVLTVELAKQLKGKKIYWFYFGYSGNERQVYEMVVGDIVSELDYYSTQPCDGYSSRAEYWKSYMTDKQLKEKENTLLLLNAGGGTDFIYVHLNSVFFREPTFTCSDEDREVFYIESDL